MTESIDLAAARDFCVRLLSAASLFEVDAEAVADAVLWAERTGRREDGLQLLPSILEKIESGSIDPRGRPLVLAEGPAIVRLDGSSGCGPVAAAMAADLVTERVTETGLAACLVKGGRDLASPLYVANRLANDGWLGVCVTAVARTKPLIRFAAVGPGEAPRPCVEWSEESMPVAFGQFIAGLIGGHPLHAKHDATNPDVSEHLIAAVDVQQYGDLGRFSRVVSDTVPEVSPAVEVESRTLETLRSAASDRGVEAGL